MRDTSVSLMKVFYKKKAELISPFVGLLGFEPRQTESKSVVLPLHHNPVPVYFGMAKIREYFKRPKHFCKQDIFYRKGSTFECDFF